VNQSGKKIINNWTELGDSIGILGGTFDPIQRAHIELARAVIESSLVQDVVIIPAKQNPHKLDLPNASDNDRMAMIELAVEDLAHIFYSDIEINSSDLSYTYETILKLRTLLPVGTKLFFILGVDAALGLPRWHRVEELSELLDGFIVFPRNQSVKEACAQLGPELSTKVLTKIIPKDLAKSYQIIAATLIRTALHTGDTELLHNSLDKKVLSYVKKKKLYQ
jgi:nicotinate-nucleotide adenylyltransferase